MDDPELLAAYSEYYLAVSRAQALRACSLAGLSPRSVLDLGAGPGSVSLALATLGARSFTLVDSSALALSSAERALGEAASAMGAEFSVSAVVADLESPGAAPAGPFDLVAFGHCLNEIGRGEDRIARRLAIIRGVSGSIAPGGSVLVMEPSTLAASRDALSLRDALVAEGWTVRAPCTRGGPCPALAAGPASTCHDEAAWDVPEGVRRLASAAGLDRDLIKMAWYVFSPPLGVRGASDRPPDEYRVVSMPMLNKGGRVRYLLCGPAGRFPFSAKKDDEAARRAGFFSLGRFDLLRVENPEIREGGWGFGPGTSIRAIESLAPAAPGKIE